MLRQTDNALDVETAGGLTAARSLAFGKSDER
jgi:hypothetical protein